MKAIVVEKEKTRSEIDRILKEETNTIKFVCINDEEVNNNGFQDLIKDVNFEIYNVIVI